MALASLPQVVPAGYRLLRGAAAIVTTLSALVATSVVSHPARALPSHPCALERTGAHHSEGVDTWNRAYPRPEKLLRAAMIFLSFPDADPLTTPRELTADHFPATSDFFRRASYGRFRLAVDPQPRWIRMPSESFSYGITRDWAPEHRNRYLRDAIGAADRKVDFSRYDIVYLVADPDAPGVDSDATKVVNFDKPLTADGTKLRRIVTLFEQHPPDRNVLAHETGHVFDLPDLYHRPTDGKGDWDTHVGDWDMMGSQFGLAPEPFGWHKWRLGWLANEQVACATNGRGRFTLAPLAAPAHTPAPAPARGFGGTRLVVVRTGPTSALAIEARERHGNDAATCTEGVLVYHVRTEAASGGGPIEVLDGHPRTEACWDTSVYPPLADAPLGEGDSLRVPGFGESVRVTVTERLPSGSWRIQLEDG